MDFTVWLIPVLMSLANPMAWLIGAMVFILSSRLRNRISGKGGKTSHRMRAGIASAAAAGAAFQFLSLAYRPNHAFVAKAQIQQEEDADDDDGGGPDTPLKHLHRQLRRIRRGEQVDRLMWRLE